MDSNEFATEPASLNEAPRAKLTPQQSRAIAGRMLSLLSGKQYTTYPLSALSPAAFHALGDGLADALQNSTAPEIETTVTFLSENCVGFRDAWWRLSRNGVVPHTMQVIVDGIRSKE